MPDRPGSTCSLASTLRMRPQEKFNVVIITSRNLAFGWKIHMKSRASHAKRHTNPLPQPARSFQDIRRQSDQIKAHNIFEQKHNDSYNLPCSEFVQQRTTRENQRYHYRHEAGETSLRGGKRVEKMGVKII